MSASSWMRNRWRPAFSTSCELPLHQSSAMSSHLAATLRTSVQHLGQSVPKTRGRLLVVLQRPVTPRITKVPPLVGHKAYIMAQSPFSSTVS